MKVRGRIDGGSLTHFSVVTAEGRRIAARVPGRRDLREACGYMPGDVVTVEPDPFDPSHGTIVGEAKPATWGRN